MHVAQRFTRGLNISLESLSLLVHKPWLFMYAGFFFLLDDAVEKMLKIFGLYHRFIKSGELGNFAIQEFVAMGLDLFKVVMILSIAVHVVQLLRGKTRGVKKALGQFVLWAFVYLAVLHIVSAYVLWNFSNLFHSIAVTYLLIVFDFILLYLVPVIFGVEDTTFHGALVRTPQFAKHSFVEFLGAFSVVIPFWFLKITGHYYFRNIVSLRWAVRTVNVVGDIFLLTLVVTILSILYLRYYKKNQV